MKSRNKAWYIPILCGVAVLLAMRFVFIFAYVPSDSMEPAIREGQCIFGLRLFGEPQRGDVLIFEHEGRRLVKRVAACPGDMVYIDVPSGEVSVNRPLSGAGKTLTVPMGCYFMLGDNAGSSYDARYWENPFVPSGAILAQVLFISPAGSA